MRFSSALAVASLASMVIAIPVQLTQRSILTDIDSAISKLEDGAGITAIEDELDSALGGALSKVSFFSCSCPSLQQGKKKVKNVLFSGG